MPENTPAYFYNQQMGSYRNSEGFKYNYLLKYLLHLHIRTLIVFKYLLYSPDSVKITPEKFVLYKIKAFLHAVTHFKRDYTYRVNKNKRALTVQWV